MNKRVYLAGPEVFLRKPLEAGEAKKRLCAEYGFEGVFPLDASLDLSGLTPGHAALKIRLANESLIRSCGLVIANITPFRGPSADVGTGYEMGFARALGLPVFAYTNDSDNYVTRVAKHERGHLTSRADGTTEDADGMQVESFSLVDNLMLVAGMDHDGGHFVACDSPPGERYTHLEAFEVCLIVARDKLG